MLEYVMKWHASRRPHFDFRILLDGALVSFVIHDGPSVDPGVPRIAIRVNDHDPDYMYSERQIPEGKYGAGTVMVWDAGTLTPFGTNDPAVAFANGEIEFELRGSR